MQIYWEQTLKHWESVYTIFSKPTVEQKNEAQLIITMINKL